MTDNLKDQTVLVIGRGSGLARPITLAARDAGAQVVAASRDQEALSAAPPRISSRASCSL
jgi:NAD(P)-dependent dehydrogenase (short-subunit alcohol dehydrogenase family)